MSKDKIESISFNSNNQCELSHVFEYLSESAVLLDSDFKIQDLNVACELMMRKAKEKYIGKDVNELIRLTDIAFGSPVLINDIFNASDAKGSSRELFALKSEAGELAVKVKLIRTSQNTAYSFVVLIENVSAELELKNALALRTLSLDYVETSVLVSDAVFEDKFPSVLYINQSFERHSQYGVNEILGMSLSSLFMDKDLRDVEMILNQVSSRNPSVTDEIKICRKDGTKFIAYLNVYGVFDVNQSLTHFIFTFSDISKLRRLEENIRQSQRMEGVGKFTGGIAHDFNNILAVVNSFSDLLALKVGSDETLKRYVSNIRSAGDKGANLVSQLMTFSRREVAEPKSIYLDAVARDTKSMMDRVISEDIVLEVEAQDDIKPIHADLSQVEQILVNLCVNARDAIKDKGRISISIKNVHVSALEDDKPAIGEYVLLDVSDTGSGMNEETKRKVFEPFFTTKPIGKGTGLGLATVLGIIKKYNGYIHVDTEEGKGTSFKIYFHVKKDDFPGVHSNQIKSLSSKEILIVSSDATFSDCICALLNLNGYSSKHILGDFELKEYLVQAPHVPDLIMLDLDLSMHARDTLQGLKDENKDLRIIYALGDDSQKSCDALSDSHISYLLKPFSLNSVLKEVESHFKINI